MLTPFSLRHKLHAQSRAALSSWVLSKFPNSRHSELIKWTNSFIAKRQPWKRKHVLFMIDYKITVLTLLGEGNQRIQLACEKHATISWMTGEQELFIWFLKLLKPDVEDGIKLTRNDSLAAREPIVNRTRNTLEITEDNTVGLVVHYIRLPVFRKTPLHVGGHVLWVIVHLAYLELCTE